MEQYIPFSLRNFIIVIYAAIKTSKRHFCYQEKRHFRCQKKHQNVIFTTKKNTKTWFLLPKKAPKRNFYYQKTHQSVISASKKNTKRSFLLQEKHQNFISAAKKDFKGYQNSTLCINMRLKSMYIHIIIYIYFFNRMLMHKVEFW